MLEPDRHSSGSGVEIEDAETEEKYQVFGLSTGMDGEPSMEVQIVRCGADYEEVLGK